MFRIVFIVFLALIFSGCSTLINGTTTKMTFATEPKGATVRLPNFKSCETPCVLEVENRVEKVLIEKEGYKSIAESTDRKVALGAGLLGNLLIPSVGVVGVLIDSVTGGIWYLDRNPMYVTLTPLEENATQAELIDDTDAFHAMMGYAYGMGARGLYNDIQSANERTTLSVDMPFNALSIYAGYASRYVRLKVQADWTYYSLRSYQLYGTSAQRHDSEYYGLDAPVHFTTLSAGLWGDVSLLRIDPFDIYVGLMGGWESFFMRDVAASLSEYANDFIPQNGFFWGFHEGLRLRLSSQTSVEIGAVVRIGGVGIPAKLASYLSASGYTREEKSYSGAFFLAVETTLP